MNKIRLYKYGNLSVPGDKKGYHILTVRPAPLAILLPRADTGHIEHIPDEGPRLRTRGERVFGPFDPCDHEPKGRENKNKSTDSSEWHGEGEFGEDGVLGLQDSCMPFSTFRTSEFRQDVGHGTTHAINILWVLWASHIKLPSDRSNDVAYANTN